MKPAMALLRKEQKDGHFQLFRRMSSFQITQDKKVGWAQEGLGGSRWGKMLLVLRRGQSQDLFLNFML